MRNARTGIQSKLICFKISTITYLQLCKQASGSVQEYEILFHSHILREFCSLIVEDRPFSKHCAYNNTLPTVRDCTSLHLLFRFFSQGKFIRINFDTSGYIAGANIETCTFNLYLLEAYCLKFPRNKCYFEQYNLELHKLKFAFLFLSI